VRHTEVTSLIVTGGTIIETRGGGRGGDQPVIYATECDEGRGMKCKSIS
jgi:hypothetical protein